MKQSKLVIKETTSLVLQGVNLAVDTTFYWYDRVRNTVRTLVFDAFSLNVAGAVADFQWEEWEQERSEKRAQPINQLPNYPINQSTNQPFPKSTNVKRFFLRKTKATLRLIILDVPDKLRKKSNSSVEADPFANRYRA